MVLFAASLGQKTNALSFALRVERHPQHLLCTGSQADGAGLTSLPREAASGLDPVEAGLRVPGNLLAPPQEDGAEEGKTGGNRHDHNDLR